ncbi:MAG: hypothetical protein MO852_13105, partial [Candidatus Devosia euplotis]|nr:hypothetical protein [Candidatus Devosia euplotis]
AAIENDDDVAAEHWENRAVVLGGMLAALYGAWCLVSMLIVRDPYAELVSASLSIAVMVGIVARNFGLDRLVTIQMPLAILPLSLSLLLRGDAYHPVLAILLFVMLSSFRQLAAGIHSILLSAVHVRVEASRLAAELDMAMTTLGHGLCLLDENRAISVANEQAVQLFTELGIAGLIGAPLLAVMTRLENDGAVPRTAGDQLMELVNRKSRAKSFSACPANAIMKSASARGATAAFCCLKTSANALPPKNALSSWRGTTY